LNPKKRKHQETHVASSSTEELWKGESSARGSWQEKDAGMLAFYLKETETWDPEMGAWEQKQGTEELAWKSWHGGPEAWEQKQEEHEWEKELDYERAVCHEAYDLQKAHDLQQEQDLQKEQDYDDFLQEENKQKEDDLQKAPEQDDLQLQPELPSTVGHHNPPARTGAAKISRTRVALAVAEGTTNPSKAGLKHAEKQLRQCQGKGKSKQICVEAKNKVRDYQARVLTWDHHRQSNIEGTQYMTTFDRQRLGAAADEYATLKFSENIGNFGAAERAEI
jgi:hypothetical protein